MSNTTSTKLSRNQAQLTAILEYRKHPFFQVTMTSFLSLALLAIFAVFAIQPSIFKITALRKEIAKDQEILSTLTTKRKNLEIIAGRFGAIAPKMPGLELAVPFGPEYQSIHKKLAVLTYENRVTMVSLSSGEVVVYTQQGDPYRKDTKAQIIKLPITLRVRGSYEDLMSFLRTLLAFDRMIEVENLSILPEITKSDAGGQIMLNVSANVYYLADSTLLDKLIESDDKEKKAQ